jgi:protein involved in polysaccharide export with SLBB domain
MSMTLSNVTFKWCRSLVVFGLLAAGLFLAGCETDPKFPDVPEAGIGGGGALAGSGVQGAELIKVGMVLTVSISDIPTPPPAMDVTVREDGTITLLLNQSFTAAGKTAGALEKEIHDRYVPRYYTQLTVAIRFQNGFYFVTGEVKSPNRYPYMGPTTVLKAISSASDFTDWARKSKVRLTRTDGTSFTVDCIKAISDPSLDLAVYPGDKIHVPRKIL